MIHDSVNYVVSNHTHYLVSYPELLAIGRFNHDMYARIVRQDYTGAHFHALGGTSPQRLFILCLCGENDAKNSRQLGKFCNALPFETFFHPLQLPSQEV